MMTGDFDSVDKYVAEIEPLVEREGNLGAKIHCDANSCIVAMARGNLDAAVVRAQEGAELCEAHGFPWISFDFAWLGMVQLWRGDWDGARGYFDRVLSQHLKASAHYGAEPAFALAGLATMADASASTLFDEGYPTPLMDEDNGIGPWLWCMAKIEAGVLLGHHEDAASLYPNVVQLLAEGTRVTWGLGLTEKFAGIAAAAGKDWPAAEKHFQTAIKQAEDMPHRLDQPEVRRWYARMLQDRNATGDQERARELLDEARTLYEQLGMPRHIEMVGEMLTDAPASVSIEDTLEGSTATTQSEPLAETQIISSSGDTAPRSLAVLPLANLSGDPQQEFFVAGMHDALINELARIKSLTVISRTSTMPFAGSTEPLPEIAARLGVEAVVEGSVLKAGDQVRINLQLINAQPEKHLWADSFDGAMEDILDVHRRVAGELSSAVKAQLTEDEEQRLETTRKVDPQVYEIYLRARHVNVFVADDNWRGIRLYEQATARDPDFAPAYAGMARNYVYLATLGAAAPGDVLPRAAEAAQRAIELDPESGEARSIHGYTKLFLEWDWKTAGDEMKLAREMEPNNVAALYDSVLFLALTGSVNESEAVADRIAELDPMSADALFWQGWTRFLAERYEEAIEIFMASIEVDPALPYPPLWIGAAYGMMGKAGDALTWARKAEALDPESHNTDFLAVLGATYVMGGHSDDARRLLKRIGNLETDDARFPAQQGYLHGWLGEFDEAVAFYEKAFAERNPGVIFLGNHPVCDQPRSDPRIMKMLEGMGFPAIRPMLPQSDNIGNKDPA
jgi:TolB-like protein